jgi:hypothetical protein
MNKRIFLMLTSLATLGALSTATALWIEPTPAGEATSEQASSRTEPLTDEELSKVVTYIVGVLTDPSGCVRYSFTDEEITEATGILIPADEGPRIQQAVLAELQKSEKGQACLASLSRCHDYEACSVAGNLATAKGDQLDLYQKEKANDGVLITEWSLPEFEASDLDGKTVNSAQLRGTPTLLVVLARHCGHSVQSLAVLEATARKYQTHGVRLVAVLVNTDSPEQAKLWFGEGDRSYEVWITADESIGDTLENHLVPSYFLVHADGKVEKKLIGYKSQELVNDGMESFLGLEKETTEISSG